MNGLSTPGLEVVENQGVQVGISRISSTKSTVDQMASDKLFAEIFNGYNCPGRAPFVWKCVMENFIIK